MTEAGDDTIGTPNRVVNDADAAKVKHRTVAIPADF
jgi:hypothetical protein